MKHYHRITFICFFLTATFGKCQFVSGQTILPKWIKPGFSTDVSHFQVSPDNKYLLAKGRLFNATDGRYIKGVVSVSSSFFTNDSKHILTLDQTEATYKQGVWHGSKSLSLNDFLTDSLKYSHGTNPMMKYFFYKDETPSSCCVDYKISNGKLIVHNENIGRYIRYNPDSNKYFTDTLNFRGIISKNDRYVSTFSSIEHNRLQLEIYLRKDNSLTLLMYDTLFVKYPYGIDYVTSTFSPSSKYLLIDYPDSTEGHRYNSYTITDSGIVKNFSKVFPLGYSTITGIANTYSHSFTTDSHHFICSDSTKCFFINIESGNADHSVEIGDKTDYAVLSVEQNDLWVSTQEYPYLHKVDANTGVFKTNYFFHNNTPRQLSPLYVNNTSMVSFGGDEQMIVWQTESGFVEQVYKFRDEIAASNDFLYDGCVFTDSAITNLIVSNDSTLVAPLGPVATTTVDHYSLTGSTAFMHHNLACISSLDTIILLNFSNGYFSEKNRFVLSELNGTFYFPQSISLSRNGKFLLVVQSNGRTEDRYKDKFGFVIINLETNQTSDVITTDTLTIGFNAKILSAISSNGSEVVLSTKGGTYVIDVETELTSSLDTALRSYTQDEYPVGVLLGNDNNLLYLLNVNCISVIDINKDSILSRLSTEEYPYNPSAYYPSNSFGKCYSFDISPNDKYIGLQIVDGTVACFENPFTNQTHVYREELSKHKLVHMYPNPAKNLLNIELTLNTFSHLDLSIFNTLGVKVATIISNQYTQGISPLTFDTSNLPDGLYYYKLTTSSETESGKFLVAH